MIRAPAFAIVAIVTLALGIGATTAIFSVVYGVLLRRATLLVALAVLALGMAAVGLYGVIATRMALGAQPSNVIRMVLRQGLQLSAAGIVLGMGVAFALARTLTALLYGIAPTDAWLKKNRAGTRVPAH